MATVPSIEPAEKLTYEDYCRIPEDGMRHEVLGGVEVVSPSPGERHQRIAQRLSLLLGNWCEQGDAGRLYFAPFDVLLGPNDIVQPDLLVILAENLEIVTEANVQGPPDLVIEVLSPTSHRTDLVRKLPIYARAGVREYWIIDPIAERIEVFRNTGPHGDNALEKAEELWRRLGGRLTSPLLEGFDAAVEKVFA